MKRVLIEIPKVAKEEIWRHLLPRRFIAESAAFMYVRQVAKEETTVFRYIDWYLVPPEGFVSRSVFHFELTDETRATVIKQAHDLNASLVELHSHDDRLPPVFSPTDFYGFHEFVPHIWWRLKERPYLALVVSRAGFDGLAWVKGPNTPHCLDGIGIGETFIKSTGFSFEMRHKYYEK